jgi:cation-transporting ATPase F
VARLDGQRRKGLQLPITYLPAMNTLFHTAPVGVGSWAYALGAGALAFVLVETDKVLWRHGRRS